MRADQRLLLTTEFRRLATRFDEYAARSKKASHLGEDLGRAAIQAGRLLLEAIDAGAFPKSKKEVNGEWWDRQEGRVPGFFMSVVPGLPENERERVMNDAEELKRVVAGSLNDRQRLDIWIHATVWLMSKFPSRFVEGAADAFFAQIAYNRNGELVDRNRRPLRRLAFINGQPVPKGFKVADLFDEDGKLKIDIRFESRLDGEPAYRHQFFDDDDKLHNLQQRAEVSADACRVLADLIGLAEVEVEAMQSRQDGDVGYAFFGFLDHVGSFLTACEAARDEELQKQIQHASITTSASRRLEGTSGGQAPGCPGVCHAEA